MHTLPTNSESHDVPGQSPRLTRPRLAWLIGCWILVICVGFALAIDHGARPGDSAEVGPIWPADSQLERAQDGSTLVMFLHSECPCSAASLEELETLASATVPPERMFVVVADVRGNRSSRNIERARSIPGATLFFDQDGKEASRFGSHTSGDVAVYNAAGTLVYSGGLTAGRGHSGANRAADAARQAVAGEVQGATQMPVFGCPLTDASSVDR